MARNWLAPLLFLATLASPHARVLAVEHAASSAAAAMRADAHGNVQRADDDNGRNSKSAAAAASSASRLLLDNLKKHPNVTCAGKNNNYEILLRFPGMVNASFGYPLTPNPFCAAGMTSLIEIAMLNIEIRRKGGGLINVKTLTLSAAVVNSGED